METLAYRLSLDNSEYVGGMRAAIASTQQLNSTARSSGLGPLSGELQMASNHATSFAGATRGASSSIQGLAGAAQGGGGSIAGMAAGFTGAGLALAGFKASVSAAKAVLSDYAPYDSAVRGMFAIEGSAGATKARLAELKQIAKLPGLGFQEAVQGDIRLRSAGLSADLSAKSLKAFGNALATVGGGKAELGGVVLALTQISAKGKITAEDISQIAERVPQIREAMSNAFGTADTEKLQAMGMSATTFIEGITTELGKLPSVTGGAQSALENYDDAWQGLKNSANEFAVGISGYWIGEVTRGFSYAASVLDDLKEKLGIEAPGLKGQEKATKEAENRLNAKLAEKKRVADGEKALLVANEAYANDLERKRIAGQKAAAEKELQITQQQIERARGLREREAAIRLTEEQNLQRKIAAIKAAPEEYGQAAIDKAQTPTLKADRLQRTVELQDLEKQLVELQKRQADEATRTAEQTQRAAEAERKKQESAAKQQASRTQSAATFDQENQLLAAKAAGHTREVTLLERQARVEAVKLKLMKEQGMAAEDAERMAKKRVELEDRVAGRRPRGLRSAEDSATARADRMSAADRARAASGGAGSGSNTERLAAASRQRGREARAAAAARMANLNPSPKADSATAILQKQQSTLSSIDQRLADLGMAS